MFEGEDGPTLLHDETPARGRSFSEERAPANITPQLTSGVRMNAAGNIVAADLRVLFVAINPPPSASEGGPFSSPTNAFWPLLHASGLTTRLFAPLEVERLLEEKLGLVSMVARPTKAASELHPKELREGALRLATIVQQWRPRTIALLGLTLRPFVFPDEVEPGPGLKRQLFCGARVFVLPNPSGRNRAFPGMAGKLPWYRALADLR
jgi:TDG/mug DNA glycosylase family protein